MDSFENVRTVEWKDGKVILIDQTKLPEEFQLLECKEVGEVANAIKRMAVRGAPAIGAAAAMGIALAAQASTHKEREAFLLQMRLAADTLISTRPTAVNLKWAVDRVHSKLANTDKTVDELRKLAVEEANAIAEEDIAANRRLGGHGATLLADGDRVLTHCKWQPLPAEYGHPGHRQLWNGFRSDQSRQSSREMHLRHSN